MKHQNEKKEFKTKLKVYGMTCASCVNKIERAFKKQKNVKAVSVSLKEEFVLIQHSKAIPKKELERTILMSGYKTRKPSATRQGLLYGLIPHAGCIAFIFASIVGATFFTSLLRPLMMSANFFYFLIGVSFIFATVSSLIYLNKNNLLSATGIKRQKKYLATLYGSTIFINIALFLVIFPLTANISSAMTSSATTESSVLEIDVIIPCSGHAPLIINEVSFHEGVQEVRYSFPYKFTVKYDSEVTNFEDILLLEIFKEFPAKKINLTDQSSYLKEQSFNCISESCSAFNVACQKNCGTCNNDCDATRI